MADNKTGKNSDASIQKASDLLVNTSLTPCSSLISNGSYNGDVYSCGTFKCGDTWDIQKAVADGSSGVGRAWTNVKTKNGCVLQVSHTPICHKSNCYSCGWGQCTPSVAGHIKTGNIPWTGRCGNGYEMKDFLPNFGFKQLNVPMEEINTYSKMDKWTQQNAKPGDVCVMNNPGGGFGHATMWNGKAWASDFIQCHALCYGSRYTYLVQLFRFQDCKETETSGTKKPKDTSKGDNGKPSLKKIKVAFIGDDFSIDESNDFPETIRKTVNIDTNYFYGFARMTAGSKEFSTQDNTRSNKIYNTCKSKNNCPDALKRIMDLEPKYCIVALGVNEQIKQDGKTSYLEELCEELSKRQIQVILVYMKTLSKKETLKKIYDGVSVKIVPLNHRVNLMNEKDTSARQLGATCGKCIANLIK